MVHSERNERNMEKITYTLAPCEKFGSKGRIWTFIRMFLYSSLSFGFIVTSLLALTSYYPAYPSDFLDAYLRYLPVGISAGLIMGVLFGLPAAYLYHFVTMVVNIPPSKDFIAKLEDRLAKMGYKLHSDGRDTLVYKPSLLKNSIFSGKLTIQKGERSVIVTGTYSSIRRLINALGLVEYKENKANITKELRSQLLPGERVLFYSPNRDRWENYRFDLMAYITIGMSFIAYFFSLMILMFTFNSESYTWNFSDILSIVGSFVIIVVFILFDKIAINTIIIAKHNYPLILTNKRIITEMDFLRKKKPLGTFIEDVEKVAYVEESKRVAYVYLQKKGVIKRVALSYLSKYRDNFRNALKELFGERYVERILWQERRPLNKNVIEEIFQDERGGGVE